MVKWIIIFLWIVTLAWHVGYQEETLFPGEYTEVWRINES